EHHRDPPAPADRLALKQALQSRQRLLGADKDAQPCRGVGDDTVERLDLLRGEPQALLLAPDIDGDDQRLAAVEQGPRRGQYVREHGDLEHAAHVRQLYKRETVAARGGALLAADDDPGEPEAGGVARRQRRRQVGIEYRKRGKLSDSLRRA